MPIAESLSDDLKTAMKSGDNDRVSAIRLIRSAIRNREIERGGALDDGDAEGILMSFVRQCEESLEQFFRAGREDLIEKEKRYIEIARSYLPPQFTAEELDAVVRETLSEVGASGPADTGKVMKALMPKVRGRADGRAVSVIVKKALSGSQSNS